MFTKEYWRGSLGYHQHNLQRCRDKLRYQLSLDESKRNEKLIRFLEKEINGSRELLTLIREQMSN